MPMEGAPPIIPRLLLLHFSPTGLPNRNPVHPVEIFSKWNQTGVFQTRPVRCINSWLRGAGIAPASSLSVAWTWTTGPNSWFSCWTLDSLCPLSISLRILRPSSLCLTGKRYCPLNYFPSVFLSLSCCIVAFNALFWRTGGKPPTGKWSTHLFWFHLFIYSTVQERSHQMPENFSQYFCPTFVNVFWVWLSNLTFWRTALLSTEPMTSPVAEYHLWGSLMSQTVKNPPAIRENWVQFLSREDPLEESVATHSSILAWRMFLDQGAWWATVFLGVARVWHDWATNHNAGHTELHRTVSSSALNVCFPLLRTEP